MKQICFVLQQLLQTDNRDKLLYTPVYKTHFFPSNFCLEVGVRLIHANGIF